MKTLVTDYSFNKTAKTITFNKFTSIDLGKILLITNATDGIIIFNFASQTLGGTVATNVLTLEYDTTSMDNSDKLLIYYDDEQTDIPYSEVLTASDSITPTSGKRIKVIKAQIMQNPDNSTSTKVTLNFTSIGDFSTGWAYSDRPDWTGAVDEVLNITLAGSEPVSVNIRYREV